MFTGIIEEIGQIRQIKKGKNSAQITIAATKVLENTRVGDSIAVNGVCLTVTRLAEHEFEADIMHETLNYSSLGALTTRDGVNLERAMAADGRFGGHIVSGHIDGTGRITGITPDDNAIRYTISTRETLLRHIVKKGSITIDGISLTVTEVTDDNFGVSVIPHTAQETMLSTKKIGAIVNLETDVIAKYVEKLLGITQTSAQEQHKAVAESSIDRNFLQKYGF